VVIGSLRFAVHGIVSDGGGSGAGTFTVLLAGLLERGHRVDFLGVPTFTEPRSLERYPGYRFVDVSTRGSEGVWRFGNALPTPYPRAAAAQAAILLCQIEAVRRVHLERERYDVMLCTDAQQLWPAKIPVLSWPQSPPQTEAAALREPAIMRTALRSWGLKRYLAVQLFYAYRAAQARAALGASDLYVCGSSWARDAWLGFGATPEQLAISSYLVDIDPFSKVAPPGALAEPTFLWLGRASPRKRLDLFLAGFSELRKKFPNARARVVGNLGQENLAAPLVGEYGADQGVSFEPGVGRAEVPLVFAGSDVLVQPSENENFGFAVAEALAAGRPVVLGPKNGTRDYAGEAGFVFTAYEPRAVAAAMERALVAVQTDGAGVAERARAAAEKHFRTERVIERFEALARELVGRSGKKT
jgi:glycosyltransferase involved in cell wall biosynthesis